MKKLITALLFCFLIPIFAGCEVSNTELANSLEGNMTRLIYSVGYLDSISTEELTGLVNNSTYFTHSSLFAGEPVSNAESTDPGTNLVSPTANETLETELSGGLPLSQAISGRTAFQDVAYRSSVYTSPLTATSTTGGYNSGVVDMTLLETSANDLNNILLEISGKRGIIMLYCTDLRTGRATLSPEDKSAISEYNDIIKETTNYLNNTAGALTNHFNGITSISANENSAEIINAKLIRANEVLKTRYAKLDTCLDSLNAVINILVNSIGYDYAYLYNQTTPNNNIVNEQNTPVTLEETEENLEIVDNTPLDSTINSNNQNTTLPENLITTPNQSVCPPCENSLYPNTVHGNQVNNQNTSSLIPSTYPLPHSDDDTIINYNYSGNNSSNINNNTHPDSPNNVIKDSTNTLVTPNNNLAPTKTLPENTISESEVILNGGLIKSTTEEIVTPTFLNANFELDDKLPKDAEQLKLGSGAEKNNILTPPILDFSEPEISESEKELTPEILPFAGSPNAEIKTVSEVEHELGQIMLLPFIYEEDDVIKIIPKV